MPHQELSGKAIFLHKAIHSFSKTQQEAVVFTFLSLTLHLPCTFYKDGRSCPSGVLLWQGMPRMIEDLTNHFNLFAIHQKSHADPVFLASRQLEYSILSVHIPACPQRDKTRLLQ